MIPIATFASTCNSIASRSTPCSRAMLSIPIACCAGMQAAYSSASPELKAMTLWSLLQLQKMVSKTDVARRHTFPRLPFSCPVTVTLDSLFYGCFLPSKHDPNVWRSFYVSSDTFQLQPITSCRFGSCLGIHSHSVLSIWPVNCPIVQSGHGAFVHSNFLFTQMFTCHLSISTVSDLFEGIPMSILLFAHLSRFTLLLVNPLFLLVSDSTHPQFFGSVSCPARTLSQNFSMKFVCSA